jgi:hypothetical protein
MIPAVHDHCGVHRTIQGTGLINLARVILRIEKRAGKTVSARHEFSLGGKGGALLPEGAFRIQKFGLGPFLGKEERGEGRLLFGKAAANRAIETNFAGDELGQLGSHGAPGYKL